MLHEPTFRDIPIDEIQEWLYRQQQSGKIRCWGLAGEQARLAEFLKLQVGLASSSVLQTRVDKVKSELKPISIYQRIPNFLYGAISIFKSSKRKALAIL